MDSNITNLIKTRNQANKTTNMNTTDRTEVREMIHSTLEGWEKATVARENMTLVALEKIESHLGKINGKVDAHERFIVGVAAVKKNSSTNWVKMFQIIGVCIAFGMFIIGYLNLTKKIDITESNMESTIKTEIRAQEGISSVTRGGYVKYNDYGISDSVKIR